LARLALQQVSEAQGLPDTLDTAPDLLSRRAPCPQAEGDVLEDGHVRLERVVLENHGHVAAPRLDIIDDSVTDQDLAGRYLLETSHHTKRSRLPAPGRADEHHELAVFDLEREILDGGDSVVELGHPGEGDGRRSTCDRTHR